MTEEQLQLIFQILQLKLNAFFTEHLQYRISIMLFRLNKWDVHLPVIELAPYLIGYWFVWQKGWKGAGLILFFIRIRIYFYRIPQPMTWDEAAESINSNS